MVCGVVALSARFFVGGSATSAASAAANVDSNTLLSCNNVSRDSMLPLLWCSAE